MKLSKTVKIILGAVLVGGAAYGGYVWWKKKKTAVAPTVTPTAPETTTTTPSGTPASSNLTTPPSSFNPATQTQTSTTPPIANATTNPVFNYRNAANQGNGKAYVIVDDTNAYQKFAVGDQVAVTGKYNGTFGVWFVNNGTRANGTKYAVVYLETPFTGDGSGTIKKV